MYDNWAFGKEHEGEKGNVNTGRRQSKVDRIAKARWYGMLRISNLGSNMGYGGIRLLCFEEVVATKI